MVALIDSATLSARVRAVHFSDAEDWHANDAETSLMLAVAPEIVRKTLSPTPTIRIVRTGGVRSSRQSHQLERRDRSAEPASADKGRLWFHWMVEDLSRIIQRGMAEKPPLDHSYSDNSRSAVN